VKNSSKGDAAIHNKLSANGQNLGVTRVGLCPGVQTFIIKLKEPFGEIFDYESCR